MIQGKLGEGQISKSLPFELIVSTIRRKKLMGIQNHIYYFKLYY